MAWLLHRTRDSVGLGDALAEAAGFLGSPAACMLFRPRECILVRLGSGGALDRDGEALRADGAFEARAFSELGELRWVHEGDELGQAVALAEEGAGDLTQLSPSWGPPVRIATVAHEEVRYVLWGSAAAAGSASGWTRMASARTGDLLVPVNFPGRDRWVYVRGREYLGRMMAGRDDGNVVVVEELLRFLSAEDEGE